MKRIAVAFLLILLAVDCLAQVQQGIVKTRGRMVDGQLVPGVRLQGATITLNMGNPLVSGDNGTFSFVVPSDRKYSLLSVRKSGYTLADHDYTSRSFAYSHTEPFYVVLEDENQRQADINAATRKVRKALTAQLEKREDEIEALKAQNKLTEKEYQQKLQELYDNQSESEQLVKEMAERYASTDYDQLNEYNRQVQLYIEEGELQKADSLIRSKGDMMQRVADYHQIVDANKKMRAALTKSEAGAVKTYEDLAQDLYCRHEIFLQEFKQDSALFYLKMRADLDTTNVDTVLDYADLCLKQNKFSDCDTYYNICLRAYHHNQNFKNLANVQNSLGILYSNLSDFANSEKYFKLALRNYEVLCSENPGIVRLELANTQGNLGTMYSELQLRDYANSEKYLKKALENLELLFEENPDDFREYLARKQNNIGGLYLLMGDFTNSEKYCKLAVENFLILSGKDPDFIRDLAVCQHSLAKTYSSLNDYVNAEKYFKLALTNTERLFKENPTAYCPDLANVQAGLGEFYIAVDDFINAEKYFKQSMESYENLVKQNPYAYCRGLARAQTGLGAVFFCLNNYDNCVYYCKQALDNIEYVFKENPTSGLRIDIVIICNYLGDSYLFLNDYTNSEKHYLLSLENIEYLFNENPDNYRPQMAVIQEQLGIVYNGFHDYADSEKYYKLALENYECLFGDNPDEFRKGLAMSLNNIGSLYCEMYSHMGNNRLKEAMEFIDKAISLDPIGPYYDTKGEIFLLQGKEKEALKMWKKILEIYPDFNRNYPDGTNLSNGLKERGLIE